MVVVSVIVCPARSFEILAKFIITIILIGSGRVLRLSNFLVIKPGQPSQSSIITAVDYSIIMLFSIENNYNGRILDLWNRRNKSIAVTRETIVLLKKLIEVCN